MDLQSHTESTSLGEVLMMARRRRGITQEELGKDSGIGQAAIAKLERNRTVPKVTTLCRYLRALGLTPEEELDVWYNIRGQIREINWVERLQISDYEFARDRAQAKLNGGDIYDAYGYIEAMNQLAQTSDEQAWAEMLHANRFKDMGLFALAEQSYNKATVTLGSAGNPRTMSRILLNLGDLHVEQGRYTLADAYVVYALQREMAPSSRAFAYLVKGRIATSRAGDGRPNEALDWFERAHEAYSALTTPHVREGGQAWAKLGTAEALLTSQEPAEQREGQRQLKAITAQYGPADRPQNPEIYTRASVALAERSGDDMALQNAARLAKKHGFRTILARVKATGLVPLVLATLALGASTLAPSDAFARPPEQNHPQLNDGQSKGKAHSDSRTSEHAVRDRGNESTSASPVEFIAGVLDSLLSPLHYGQTAMKGEGEDPGFSDNGPDE